jgi:predicted ATPase/transcriptional regulator with XRE-family HTH domain
MATTSVSTFASLLRRFRLAAGQSQEELAERASLSTRAVSDLERGLRTSPRPETVRLLADALALAPEQRATLIAAAHPELAAPVVVPASPPVVESLEPMSRRWSLPPALLTGLIGRDADVARLSTLLRHEEVRLVTLTGPGGVGKTRLALAAAAELAADERFADGVVLIELAPTRDPALVVSGIAAAFGVKERGAEPLADTLRDFLRPRRLLLVLDNFEQVLPAAVLVAELLAGCPGLAVLATSRERLHLRGEREVPVEPLALPPTMDAGNPISLEELATVAAVRLFVERAEEARPSFSLAPENAPAIAEICRRLDGLPLAIELAAAWVRILPPVALLERLERRLPLLGGGARDLPARQQTMRDIVAWSYDLLTTEEQALFRSLAVFAGGCTLEAAEAIGGETARRRDGNDDSPATLPPSVLDGIASLVDKNLLRQVDGPGGQARFLMFETIREFGLERLAADGEEVATRRRHAAWCLKLAEEGDLLLLVFSNQNEMLRRLVAEQDNLRAALDWSTQTGSAETALRLAGSLGMYWYFRGDLTEGVRWLEAALAIDAPAPPAARAHSLWGAGLLSLYRGDHDSAVGYLQAALDLYRTAADEWGVGVSLLLLGIIAEDSGSYARAEALLEEVYRHSTTTDSVALGANVRYHQGVVAVGRGDLQQATTRLEEARDLAQAAKATFVVSWSLHWLGVVLRERGDHGRSAAFLRDALRGECSTGDIHGAVSVLADVGILAVARGHMVKAARLFGAVDAHRKTMGMTQSYSLPERAFFERAQSRARSALGDEAFDAAVAAGRRLQFEESIAEALAVTGPDHGAPVA